TQLAALGLVLLLLSCSTHRASLGIPPRNACTWRPNPESVPIEDVQKFAKALVSADRQELALGRELFENRERQRLIVLAEASLSDHLESHEALESTALRLRKGSYGVFQKRLESARRDAVERYYGEYTAKYVQSYSAEYRDAAAKMGCVPLTAVAD